MLDVKYLPQALAAVKSASHGSDILGLKQM